MGGTKWKELEVSLTKNECKQVIAVLKELMNTDDQHFHISRNTYSEKEINDVIVSIKDSKGKKNKYTIMGKAIGASE